MADVTIDASIETSAYKALWRVGPFWKSTLIGYVIYIDSGVNLVYSKTTDGGATWSAANEIVAANVQAVDCWADWQTDGDTGTKIHMVCPTTSDNTIKYAYLDTSDDSEGTDTVESCQGNGSVKNYRYREYCGVSITKTRGGNLAVYAKYRDTNNTSHNAFYTSPDGNTWTSKTSPYEAEADHLMLFPANLADDDDLWAVYWDSSATEISLKTFDDSGDSWTENSISGSMSSDRWIKQMGGDIRLSDGHLIFAAWTQIDNAASDLKVWDITDGSTITAKTDVLSNEAENVCTAVFIDQSTDDIYVTYLAGGTYGYTMDCVYKKSADGGSDWGTEKILSDDAQDDLRWCGAGAVKAANGGRFQPIWFNGDLNDLFTTTANGVSIAASGGATNVEVAVPLLAIDLAVNAPTLVRDSKLAIPLVDIDVTPQVPTMRLDRKFDIPLAAMDLAVFAPGISLGATVSVPLLEIDLATSTPTLVLDKKLDIPLAGIDLAVFAPSLIRDSKLDIPLSEIDLAVFTPTLELDAKLGIPLLGIDLAVFAPDVVIGGVNIEITVPLLAIDLAAFAPTMRLDSKLDIPLAEIDLDTYAPSLVRDMIFDIPLSEIDLAVFTPTLVLDRKLDMPLLAIDLATYVPTLSLGTNLTIPLLEIDMTTFAPTISLGATITVPLLEIDTAVFTPTMVLDKKLNIPLLAIDLATLAPSLVRDTKLNIPVCEISLAVLTPDVAIITINAIDLAAYLGMRDFKARLGERDYKSYLRTKP